MKNEMNKEQNKGINRYSFKSDKFQREISSNKYK